MDEYVLRKPLFGKEVEIAIYDMDDEFAGIACQKAYEEGQRLSRIFNAFDEESELARLNRERSLVVSPEFTEVLKIAKEFFELTDGRYDVSLGKVISQRKKGITQASGASCSFNDIRIEGDKITLTSDDVLIDLGSIAKGYIVDKMVEVLENEGVASGLVDGRGDIRLFGDRVQNIGIQHPRKRDDTIAKITVSDCSIATSGDYNQYYGTHETNHIINSKDFSSITVVCQNLCIADAFATAFFVSESKRLVDTFRNVMMMTIDKDLNIKYYNGFEKLL